MVSYSNSNSNSVEYSNSDSYGEIVIMMAILQEK